MSVRLSGCFSCVGCSSASFSARKSSPLFPDACCAVHDRWPHIARRTINANVSRLYRKTNMYQRCRCARKPNPIFLSCSSVTCESQVFARISGASSSGVNPLQGPHNQHHAPYFLEYETYLRSRSSASSIRVLMES
jgi:hypothetical protein